MVEKQTLAGMQRKLPPTRASPFELGDFAANGFLGICIHARPLISISNDTYYVKKDTFSVNRQSIGPYFVTGGDETSSETKSIIPAVKHLHQSS
ncbi:MAG: hypothetical protein WDN30_12975 [Pararobbsia sp.]